MNIEGLGVFFIPNTIRVHLKVLFNFFKVIFFYFDLIFLQIKKRKFLETFQTLNNIINKTGSKTKTKINH